MNNTLRNTLRLGAAATAALGLGAAALWAGLYDVGADAPHTRPVYALLDYARERSVAVRARELSVPTLDDAERIRQGAGNYEAMCAGCHLAPGRGPTELSRGLYPAPPNLSRHSVDPAQAFWTIRHGIKASGMPAWGASMDEAHLWNLVAFVRRMPRMDAAEYRDWIERSDGHSHGGGETAGAGSGHAGPGHAYPAHAHSEQADARRGDSASADPAGHAAMTHPAAKPRRPATAASPQAAPAAPPPPSPSDTAAASAHGHDGHGGNPAHPPKPAPARSGPTPSTQPPSDVETTPADHEAHSHRH
ncbi:MULTISPECIES: c-type cytochrome [Lysobacter]|uniref:Cytochrome c n=1 Tax=Lysobacter firmicutimachus TaxID=1792846 RepID=A0ABU8D368_9GAMM|nr:cytochrome c [Lysobacter antibioticus]